MVHTEARPRISTVSGQAQKAVKCYASVVHGLLTFLSLANSHSRIPDPATQLRNCSNDSPQCQSTHKTIIASDDNNDEGSPYESTQHIFVLTDDHTDHNMTLILTPHPPSNLPPSSPHTPSP